MLELYFMSFRKSTNYDQKYNHEICNNMCDWIIVEWTIENLQRGGQSSTLRDRSSG